MEFHTQYSGRVRVQEHNDEPSRTHQSFVGGADINNIIKRHSDGRIPLPSVGLVYEDVSELTDYRDALDNVSKVQDIFMKLPATSRAFFNNDAAVFLDWSMENDAEAVDSLVHGPPAKPTQEVPVAPATPPVGLPPAETPPAPTGDS